ncbi:hypothetical protein [Enterocloster sp.]|uniref:hypothetical protein n=1 Tax=Enterocloster sp. TaxID=2719315 RepID=UPI0039A287A0
MKTWRARRVGLNFIVNLCNGNKETVAAFAGDFEIAHLAGVSLMDYAGWAKRLVVITGNGGFIGPEYLPGSQGNIHGRY